MSTDFSKNSSTKDSFSPLMPRSAWTNKEAFLKAILQAKNALDRIEKEYNISTSMTSDQ